MTKILAEVRDAKKTADMRAAVDAALAAVAADEGASTEALTVDTAEEPTEGRAAES